MHECVLKEPAGFKVHNNSSLIFFFVLIQKRSKKKQGQKNGSPEFRYARRGRRPFVRLAPGDQYASG
jgi:hypothetical protein